MQNPTLQIILDFLHLMATIAWIGGMFFNFLVVLPTATKALDPQTMGKFMGMLFKRVRVVVYTSLIILFITGIPMKIADEFYVGVISFTNSWEVLGFVKHVFVGLLALMAIYSFEVVLPKVSKLAKEGPSPKLNGLKKKQLVLGSISFLFGIIIILLSAMMNYL